MQQYSLVPIVPLHHVSEPYTYTFLSQIKKKPSQLKKYLSHKVLT